MISPDTDRLIERGSQKSGRDETEFVPNGDQPETGAGKRLMLSHFDFSCHIDMTCVSSQND